MKRISPFKLLIAIITVAALIAVARHFNAGTILKEWLTWIAGLGSLAPLMFIALYTAAAILFIPGAILTISAGVLFGLRYGIIYVSLGATLGAACAFLIGRYVARDWVATKLEDNSTFKAIDQAIAKEGWKIVGLTRLSPVFPFNLLNYGLGLTAISFKHYVLASWAGMIPGIVMYVYIGTLIGNVTRIGGYSQVHASGQWATEITGFIATVGVVLYVTNVARTALSQRTSS